MVFGSVELQLWIKLVAAVYSLKTIECSNWLVCFIWVDV